MSSARNTNAFSEDLASVGIDIDIDDEPAKPPGDQRAPRIISIHRPARIKPASSPHEGTRGTSRDRAPDGSGISRSISVPTVVENSFRTVNFGSPEPERGGPIFRALRLPHRGHTARRKRFSELLSVLTRGPGLSPGLTHCSGDLYSERSLTRGLLPRRARLDARSHRPGIRPENRTALFRRCQLQGFH
jgi:hypothetical protein